MSSQDDWQPPMPPPYTQGDAEPWSAPAVSTSPQQGSPYAAPRYGVVVPPVSQPPQQGYPQGYPPPPGLPPQGYPPPPGLPPQGYPQGPYPQAAYATTFSRGTNGMAIAALVCGLIGGGILGVIFGHISLSQINRTGEQGRGMAIAGLVLGYLTVAAWVIYIVFFLVFVLAASSSGSA